MQDAAYPGFNHVPVESAGVIDTITEDARPALFMHSPSSIEFSLDAGTYSAAGQYGIRAAALTEKACATADGVGVSLVLKSGHKKVTVWHQEIDPFHSTDDRGVHSFTTPEFNVNVDESLLYVVDPGHGDGNTACDWSYVRDLTFARK